MTRTSGPYAIDPNKVLFIGKQGDFYSERAAETVTSIWPGARILFASKSHKHDLSGWEGDLLLSYTCPQIISAVVLEHQNLAINFHSGPPEYPGTGCYNFALYDEAPEYGVTCHHMVGTVDAGAIIEARRFPILPTDTVATLIQRSYAVQAVLFHEIVTKLAKGEPIPSSHEVWKKKATTKKDLEALCVLTPDMPEDEMRRRIRATTFPGAPGARIEVAGRRFDFASANGR